MSKAVIKIIKFYQYFSKTVSRHNTPLFLFPSVCRFYPTCSDYTIEAVRQHGPIKGLTKGLVRVIRCNPVSRSG